MNGKHAFSGIYAGFLLMTAGFAVSAWSLDTTNALCGLCFRGGGGGGGAGGIAPSILWLDLSPVERVVKNEPDLGLYSFDFSNNAFMMIGGMGYGGTRCGAKIGGGGWFGYEKYISASRNVPLLDSFSRAVIRNGDTVRVDSLAYLHTMLAYGGFIAEKNFTLGNLTLEVGGLIGGGALILGKQFDAKGNNSAFTTIDHEDSSDISDGWTAAPLLCLDIHSGIAYRVSSFIVVGMDANLLILRSNSGFNLNTDSFLTMNPGIRLRICFGNIG